MGEVWSVTAIPYWTSSIASRRSVGNRRFRVESTNPVLSTVENKVDLRRSNPYPSYRCILGIQYQPHSLSVPFSSSYGYFGLWYLHSKIPPCQGINPSVREGKRAARQSWCRVERSIPSLFLVSLPTYSLSPSPPSSDRLCSSSTKSALLQHISARSHAERARVD